MATFLELEMHWSRKRNLYYALMSGLPMLRIRELIDAIPFDAAPPPRKSK